MKKVLLSIISLFLVAWVVQGATCMKVEMKNAADVWIAIDDVEQVYYIDSIPEAKKEGGVLPGKFSVSDTLQVRFAMGNLQYRASTNTWRFAGKQYDMIGEDNENISSTYDGWIDLFGWGTSGYSDKKPYMVSEKYSDYGDAENPKKSITGTFYDWGRYNAIENGGNEKLLWRTLTLDEWDYVFCRRANANNLKSSAEVNGVNGYILLPDDWNLPKGLTFNARSVDFKKNVYDRESWAKMERAGAVFLPCAGYRVGTRVSDVGKVGYCWSTTSEKEKYTDTAGSVYLDMYHDYENYDYGRNCGFSVRMVAAGGK